MLAHIQGVLSADEVANIRSVLEGADWVDGRVSAGPQGAAVKNNLQAAEDSQIRANEYLVQAGELELVANPVQFDVAAPQSGPAPGFAEQTDEILLELGFDWDRIIEFKTAGAVT